VPIRGARQRGVPWEPGGKRCPARERRVADPHRQLDRPAGSARDRERIAVVVVLIEEPGRLPFTAIGRDLFSRRRDRGKRRRAEEARDPGDHVWARPARPDFKPPSRIPLMNWEERGAEKRLAISSASSITTGRGVSGS